MQNGKCVRSDTVTLNEFVIENNRMNLLKIDEKVFEEVRKVMNL
jgi:hypothetical protein